MALIAILTGNHLCHNPRVLKESATLSSAGHEVVVFGGWLDPALKARDQQLLQGAAFRFVPVIDLTEYDAAARWRRLGCRIRLKVSQLAFQVLGVESTWQFGYAVSALREAALRMQADLYIAHSEAALAIASELLRGKRRVGVDMEDWFSEDLLPEARRARPLRMLRAMESELLRGARHSTCPSLAMSEALVREYGCRAPTPIYNAFPWADRLHVDGRAMDRSDPDAPSIHWFSQTLGDGRGLDDLISALPMLKHQAQVHLRGQPAAGFSDWLRSELPEEWRARVHVHDLVPNCELLSRIAEHDIGFAGDQHIPPSRNLTVTNKLLQYLLGGLAVVASDTSGQIEVSRLAPGAVTLYRSGDPGDLARAINSLLDDPAKLAASKRAALDAAKEAFSWEHCEPLLLDSIDAALKEGSPQI